MRALFDLFFDITLFRRGPQHVPAFALLHPCCLLGYLFSSLCVLLIHTPLVVASLQVLIDVVLLIGLLWLSLWVRKRHNRFGQTLSALTGTGTLMSIPAFPLVFWVSKVGIDGEILGPSLLLLGLMIWSIAVIAHILRHALEIPRSASTFLALGYTLLSWTLSSGVNS